MTGVYFRVHDKLTNTYFDIGKWSYVWLYHDEPSIYEVEFSTDGKRYKLFSYENLLSVSHETILSKDNK